MINYNKLLLLNLIVIGSSTQTVAMDMGRSAASSSNSTVEKIEYFKKLILDDKSDLPYRIRNDDNMARDFSQNVDALVQFFPQKERKEIANRILRLALCGKQKKTVSETVSIALSHGADINSRHDITFKRPLIMTRAENHNILALEILIANEACVDMPDTSGRTALMGAIYCTVGTPEDRMQAITLLINAGANVNARDRDVCSPLIYAERAQKSHQEECQCSKTTCKTCSNLMYDKAIIALLQAKKAQR